MEMIEKVARAIAREYSGDPNYDWSCFEGEARVAIEAMKDPSFGVINARFWATKTAGNMRDHADFRAEIDAWNAGIEAALSSQPQKGE